jgi:hypothetical protein
MVADGLWICPQCNRYRHWEKDFSARQRKVPAEQRACKVCVYKEQGYPDGYYTPVADEIPGAAFAVDFGERMLAGMGGMGAGIDEGFDANGGMDEGYDEREDDYEGFDEREDVNELEYDEEENNVDDLMRTNLAGLNNFNGTNANSNPAHPQNATPSYNPAAAVGSGATGASSSSSSSSSQPTNHIDAALAARNNNLVMRAQMAGAGTSSLAQQAALRGVNEIQVSRVPSMPGASTNPIHNVTAARGITSQHGESETWCCTCKAWLPRSLFSNRQKKTPLAQRQCETCITNRVQSGILNVILIGTIRNSNFGTSNF